MLERARKIKHYIMQVWKYYAQPVVAQVEFVEWTLGWACQNPM